MNWRRFCIFAAAPAVYYFSSNKSGISDQPNHERSFNAKKLAAEKAIKRYMLLNGVPGVSVGVSIDGKTVWRSGVGFSDVEQCVPCTGDTVMRIASISKSMTAVITAQLVENEKLDVDAPVQNYVPSFPVKKFDNEEVKITCRQLLTHTSGIRHYKSVSFTFNS
uniref:Beta-lactamase-related domain-containing protein n=1 Tax=Panagrolaimus sp. JU765 TaxID=591449 RepID=A0AC34Q1N5_9BILA